MLCPSFRLFLGCCRWVPVLVLHWLVWNFPISFLVTRYRSLRFPCPAAVSACLARSLMYSHLPFLVLFFISLSTAVYSSCAFVLAALVRLLFSTVFLSLSLFPACGWCQQRSIPYAGSSSCQGPLHMCRARASCSVPTVFQCLSHRPCFKTIQHCTLSVCCWRW